MTGFGAAELHRPHFDLQVSIKTVNGRFLEPRFHLPREYQAFESELKKLIGTYVRRGTLDIYVHRRGAMAAKPFKVVIRDAVAKEWLAGFSSLSRQLDLKNVQLSPRDVAMLPQVLDLVEQTSRIKSEKAVLLKLAKQALKALDAERVREGKALHRELQRHLRRLNQIANAMTKLQDRAQDELRTRLISRFQSLNLKRAIDDQRLAQEAGILADRADITEEIVRLREHLKVCLQLLKSAKPEGKRLEFYIQELLRECNTIGSKSYITELTVLVVEAKTLIESFKEQVMNVE
jgi:uncharacterized protein (TIGR00255 family)